MVIDAHNPLSTTHEKHKLRDGSGKEDCNYGCLICSVEGSVTGVYGNVETLMNHIFLEHARSIGDEVAGRARCVVGRRAGAEEEWDLNILGREVLAA